MRNILPISVHTAIILAFLSCGCSHSPRVAVVDFGPQFSAALKKARDATQPDQISSMLEHKATVSLTGIPTLIVSRMAVSHNRLFVLDAFSRAVQVFSAQGAYSGQLGENGQKPGQYITPTDIKATGDTITVDDFTVHRINEYSPEGKFAQSFVYGAQGFGSGRLAYLPTTGQYVLFGNKWLPSPDPSNRTADLVHTYDKSGHYQKSVLRFPGRFLPLNLIACDTPEVYADSAANTVYIALPFDYKVYSLTPSGKISSVINEKPARFREPATRCDPKAGPEGVKAFQSWLLTWTPIVAIWQDGAYFLIEYQTFDPLRYTVDVRDLHTHRLLAQLGTNYRYLTTDTLGQEWFVRDLDGASSRPELLKGKFDEHAWR